MFSFFFSQQLGGYQSVKSAVKAASPRLKELLTHLKQFHLSWCQWRASLLRDGVYAVSVSSFHSSQTAEKYLQWRIFQMH